jgi:hypothetical protein
VLLALMVVLSLVDALSGTLVTVPGSLAKKCSDHVCRSVMGTQIAPAAASALEHFLDEHHGLASIEFRNPA